MKIGNKISSRRKELGMTQQELADKLFISVKTISKWETNRGNPEMNILPQLAKVLEIKISEIFDEADVEEEQATIDEKRTPDIMNATIEFGVAFLGLLFYFLTFISVKTNLSNTLSWYSPFNDLMSVTISITGYKVLFTMSGTNLLGLLFVLSVWISFLSLFIHIGLGVFEFVDLKTGIYQVKEKVNYTLSIVEMGSISLALLASLILSLKIGSGLIMMIILYGIVLGYRIYERKNNIFKKESSLN